MALHIEGCMLFFRVFWPICGISDNRYCTVPPTVIRILHSTVISVEHHFSSKRDERLQLITPCITDYDDGINLIVSCDSDNRIYNGFS